MTPTGIIRGVDDLGRIMIPKEVTGSINWGKFIYPAVVFIAGLPEVITGLMFKRIEEE